MALTPRCRAASGHCRNKTPLLHAMLGKDRLDAHLQFAIKAFHTRDQNAEVFGRYLRKQPQGLGTSRGLVERRHVSQFLRTEMLRIYLRGVIDRRVSDESLERALHLGS